MNANELAVLLDNTEFPLCYEAATILRQQQAEIEALEQSKDRLIKTLLDVRGQQPAAWGMTWKDGEIYDVISPAQHDEEEGDYNIPLYIHPVKELTDEKIMDYVEAFSVDMGNYYEFQPDNVLQMIRSILDEAQEK